MRLSAEVEEFASGNADVPNAEAFDKRLAPGEGVGAPLPARGFAGTQKVCPQRRGASMSKNAVTAVTLQGRHQLVVEEFPYPDVEAGCALLRIGFSSICGTDKHSFQGLFEQKGGRPLPLPIIPGHETIGHRRGTRRGSLGSQRCAAKGRGPGDRGAKPAVRPLLRLSEQPAILLLSRETRLRKQHRGK